MNGRLKLYQVAWRLRDRLEYRDDLSDDERAFLQELYRLQLRGIYLTEEDIKNMASEFNVRNSSFPGDMVGWLNDDFDPDDGDDDEDNTQDQNKSDKKQS